jgi:hypothetical protein
MREWTPSSLEHTRSTYSDLKSDLSFLIWSGSWSTRDRVATFTSQPSGKITDYDQQSLMLAIQNVKDSRSDHKTYEAYRAHLFHLQSGLSILSAAISA